MNISLERLRRLARRKSEAYGAMMNAWDAVQSSRKELSAVQAEKDRHVSYRGPKRDLETDEPFDAAIASARERLKQCEAEHDRLHTEWEASGSLARRGYEYARQEFTNKHIELPSDVQEAFR